MVLSPDLVTKHQCAVLLGVDSPLNFVLRLLEDMLLLDHYWNKLKISLFSRQFRRRLKSSLLFISSLKVALNQTLSKFFPIPGDNASTEGSLKNLAMELLQGEEIENDPENSPSMHVWNSYIDTEIFNTNLSQAFKVICVAAF